MSKQVYKVFEEEYMGDKFYEYMAYFPGAAAEDYAKDHRNHEGQLFDEPIEVEVEDENGERTKFTVECETIPVYRATEIEMTEEQKEE